jgi:TP901 family phage tail tape measure protein
MAEKFEAEAVLTGADKFVSDLEKIERAAKNAGKGADGKSFDSLGKAIDDAGDKAAKADGKFSSVGDAADGSGKKAQSGASGWSAAAKGLGVASIGVGVLAGGFTLAVGSAMEFDATMSQVGALSGATEDQMSQLGDTALMIGEKTKFGGKEAASMMAELAAAGVAPNDIIAGVAMQTANLAAAGGVDLVTAANAASTAMGVWGLKTEDMEEVVNRLTGAANVSAFGIEDMANGMASGGIAAKTFGIGMEDTTTALAALSKGGFQSGADAGTSFKSMLTGLVAPMGAGADAIDELGINVRDTQGKIKPMSGIIDELRLKLNGLSDEDRTAKMAAIFGTDGIKAAGALMAMTGDEFETMSAAMENTDAMAVAAQMTDNLSGSMDNLGGSLETASIKLGQQLTPMTRTAVDALAALVPVISGALITGLISLGATISDVVGWFQQLNASFNFAEALALAAEAVGVVADAMREKLRAVIEWIKGTFLPGFTSMGASIADALSGIIGFVQNHSEQFRALFGAMFAYVMQATENAMKLIGGIIEGAMLIISGIIQTVTGVLQGDWQKAWDGIKDIAKGVWTIIQATIQYGIDTVKNIITNGGAMLAAAWSIIWDVLKTQATQIWGGIKQAVSAGINAVPGLLSAAGPAIQTAAKAIWEAVKTAAAAGWELIKSAVKTGVEALPGLIDAAKSKLGEAGKALLEALWEAMKAVWETALDWAKELPGIAAEALKAGAGLLSTAGEWLLNKLWDGLKAIWETALAWVSELPGIAKDAIIAGAQLLYEAGKALIDKMKDGLVSAFIDAKAYVAEMPGKILAALGDLGQILYGAGKAIVSGLLGGLVDGFTGVKEEVSSWAGKIASLKGPEDYDRQLLVENGKWIASGLGNGLKDGFTQYVTPVVSSWAPSIANNFNSVQQVVTQKWADIDVKFKAGTAEIKKTLQTSYTDWQWFVDSSDTEMKNYGININNMASVSAGHLRAMIGEMKALMAAGIDSNRKASKEDIDNWMDDIRLSIENSGAPEAAQAEALAILTKMITALQQSKGLVTAEITDLMAQIAAILGSPLVPAAAQKTGWDIGGGFIAGVTAQGTAMANATAQAINNAIGAMAVGVQPAAAMGELLATTTNDKLLYTIRSQLPPALKTELNDAIRNGVDIEDALEDVLMQLPAGLAPATEAAGAMIGNALLDGARRAFKPGELWGAVYADFEPGGKYYDMYVGGDVKTGPGNEQDGTWDAFWKSIGMDRSHENRQYRVNDFEWFAQQEDWEKLGFKKDEWNWSSDPRHGLVPTTSKTTNEDFGKTAAGIQYWALRGWQEGQMEGWNVDMPNATGWYYDAKEEKWFKAERRVVADDGGKSGGAHSGGGGHGGSTGKDADPIIGDPAVFDPINELATKILEDGAFDIKDVLAATAAGNAELAAVIRKVLLGTASSEDISMLDTMGFTAENMEKLLAIIAAATAVEEQPPIAKTVQELVAQALADGIVSMGDVLSLRTGGYGSTADLLAKSIAGLTTMADVLQARQLGLDALAQYLMSQMAGLGGTSATPGAAMLNGSNYVSLAGTSPGGSGGITIDLSGSSFTGTPQQNGSAMETAVERVLRKQQSGLLYSGIRG